jgi:hypothetical protein
LAEFAPIPGVTFIGLGHKARHGKDTVAEGIVSMHPRQVRRFAFADALKAVCRSSYGMTKKDGSLLQFVGQDLRRADPLVWIKALYWFIEEMRPPVALVTDVRQTNEAEFIRSVGGVMVNVTRYNPDGTVFVTADRDPNHITEVQLDDYPYDYYIKNNRGVGDLAIAGTELFHEVMNSRD